MNIEFTEGMNNKLYEKELENEMKNHTEYFSKELSKLKTGRAHPSIAEDIKVSCYGTSMPLKELAAISAPESSMLVIQPWDKTIISEIEKALSLSDLGINPQNDGELIRLKIPPMNTNRREELIKKLNQKLESCKVTIRNMRKEVQNKIRESEKSKAISEDSSKRLQDVLQKVTDKYIKISEQIAKEKENEIKSI